MSLRWFHLVFLLLVIVGADLFGVWALRNPDSLGDRASLIVANVAMLGGLGLAAYTYYLVRKLDRRHIA
ncbi:hypothetical protein RAS2_27070 [Phycisphaerae bacterium RAS2]|nr:hypothetical protein RAS2_27070 [Phycisphaerae bacterium RAS2]